MVLGPVILEKFYLSITSNDEKRCFPHYLVSSLLSVQLNVGQNVQLDVAEILFFQSVEHFDIGIIV